MSFSTLNLLILFDDHKGHCRRVVPSLKQLLQFRGFSVDVHPIQDGPIDISGYRGLIIGSPCLGLGLTRGAPTPALRAYVREQLPDLDEVPVAVFVVFALAMGRSLDAMKGMVLAQGAEVVASHGYGLFRLNPRDHTIAAECMVRIR